MTLHYNRTSEKTYRRKLRSNPTAAEQKLWQKLRSAQLGVKFRRQYSVDQYILDFYAPQLKLAIEVDGDSHYEDDAVPRDNVRTKQLAHFGIEILRFTNRDVDKNLRGVIETIHAAVRRLANLP